MAWSVQIHVIARGGILRMAVSGSVDTQNRIHGLEGLSSPLVVNLITAWTRVASTLWHLKVLPIQRHWKSSAMAVIIRGGLEGRASLIV
jgi:hypothetical protein